MDVGIIIVTTIVDEPRPISPFSLSTIADIPEIDLALADKDDYFAGPDQPMMIWSLEWLRSLSDYALFPHLFVKHEKIILGILDICLRKFFRVCLDLRKN